MGIYQSSLKFNNETNRVYNGEYFSDIPESSQLELIFICDESGIVVDMNDAVVSRLLYTKETLIGEFIGTIMPPHLSNLHRGLFVRRYKGFSRPKRDEMDIRLSAKTHKRPIIVFDVNGEPVFVYLSLVSKPVNEFHLSHQSIPLPPSSEYFYELRLNVSCDQEQTVHVYTHSMESLARNQAGFSLTSNELVIICIDFMNSTELLELKGPMNMAFINKRFYDDIVYLITHHYYPYLNVHEIIGDSFILVLNADWTYNYPSYCALLALNFLNQLYRRSEDYISIRVGISYGKVTYGFLGPVLKIFGHSMSAATRLEGKGKLGHVLVNESYHDKLHNELQDHGGSLEVDILNHLALKEKINLKGFGDQICYWIPLDKNKECLFESV